MFKSYILSIYSTINNKHNLRPILKLNRLLIKQLSMYQFGGTLDNPTADEQAIIDLISPLKQKLLDIQSENLQIEELVNSKKDLNNLLIFIDYIHNSLPTDVEIQTLNSQISQINSIVNKY